MKVMSLKQLDFYLFIKIITFLFYLFFFQKCNDVPLKQNIDITKTLIWSRKMEEKHRVCYHLNNWSNTNFSSKKKHRFFTSKH